MLNLRRIATLLDEKWDLDKRLSGTKGKTCAYIYLEF